MGTTNQPLSLFQTVSSFLVFPEDMNNAGVLFGGKILAEMDMAAAKAVRRVLYKTECEGAVTVSLDKVDFVRPAYLGDLVELRASITRLGRTSIEIHVSVSKEDSQGNTEKICTGTFVFVSLKTGKPFPHNVHNILTINNN